MMGFGRKSSAKDQYQDAASAIAEYDETGEHLRQRTDEIEAEKHERKREREKKKRLREIAKLRERRERMVAPMLLAGTVLIGLLLQWWFA